MVVTGPFLCVCTFPEGSADSAFLFTDSQYRLCICYCSVPVCLHLSRRQRRLCVFYCPAVHTAVFYCPTLQTLCLPAHSADFAFVIPSFPCFYTCLEVQCLHLLLPCSWDSGFTIPFLCLHRSGRQCGLCVCLPHSSVFTSVCKAVQTLHLLSLHSHVFTPVHKAVQTPWSVNSAFVTTPFLCVYPCAEGRVDTEFVTALFLCLRLSKWRRELCV